MDVADVAIAAAAAWLAWKWWREGGPIFSGGAPRAGGAYPVALTPEDLERRFNFSTVIAGKVSETGSTPLKRGAPLVLAGAVGGRATIPADAEARAAVAAYAAAKAAGTLPA
ncbi:MAG TPA: hypothetical protein VFZ38_19370 [Vicinamibacterales bacterium]